MKKTIKISIWYSILMLIFIFPCNSTDFSSFNEFSITKKISFLEKQISGKNIEGTIKQKADTLELIFFGENTNDPINEKLNKIFNSISPKEANGLTPGILINYLEWIVFKEIYPHSIEERVLNLESKTNTVKISHNLNIRIENLYSKITDKKKIYLDPVIIPSEFSIKLITSEYFGSEKIFNNKEIIFKLKENIIINNRLLMLAGTPIKGKIKRIKKRGPFGISPKISIEFFPFNAIDNTKIFLSNISRSSSDKKQTGIAIATSIVGYSILGPTGIISGYFVKGKNLRINEGTELTIKLSGPVKILGIRIL